MIRQTRPISWVKAARREFERFPKRAQERVLQALMLAAEGLKADIAKPMKGLGTGVFEVALAYRSDAYRAVYALRIGEAIWVVHAFQKKSKSGIKTAKAVIEVIRKRLKRIEETMA